MGKKKTNGLYIYGKNGEQYFDPEALLNLFQNKTWERMTKVIYPPTLKEILEKKILDGDGPDVPGVRD